MKEFKLKKLFNWETASDRISKTIQKVTPAADVYITTEPGETYILLGEIDTFVLSNIQFHLANPGKQSIGDKLYIISKMTNTSIAVTYCYDASNFYMMQCGATQNPPCSVFSSGGPERDVTVFIYDGEKFCSTFDNC